MVRTPPPPRLLPGSLIKSTTVNVGKCVSTDYTKSAVVDNRYVLLEPEKIETRKLVTADH